MLGVVGVLAALGALIYLAYRGVSLLLLAPVMALAAAFVSGGVPVLAGYTQVFMGAMGQFIISYFPLFLLGAVFGRLMEDSGSATVIADRIVEFVGPENAILAVVLCCGVLTYGGVSLFVVAFAVFPVAAALFRSSQIPKRLIPAALALGAFTFTMSALPGTPAIQNAIPMPYFGTTAFAAPGLGIIAAAVMFAFGVAWLMRQAAAARTAGEGYASSNDPLARGYIAPKAEVAARAHGVGADVVEDAVATTAARADSNSPSFGMAIAPVVMVVAVNLVFSTLIIPQMDVSYLAEARYGPTTLTEVQGLWSIIVALTAAVVFVLATSWGRLKDVNSSLTEGANASVLPIANTASLVGFGAVVAVTPAFGLITQLVLSLGAFSPLVSLAVAVNALSAVTGSASGGMSIALQNLGPTYLELAKTEGVSLEAMHRVTSISSGALDALPHNGAVITVLTICKVGHAEAYRDIFMVAVVGPMLALVVVLLAATLFGGF
ncbi:MAG: GntP family permease [Pseudomonadota bacterium]